MLPDAVAAAWPTGTVAPPPAWQRHHPDGYPVTSPVFEEHARLPWPVAVGVAVKRRCSVCRCALTCVYDVDLTHPPLAPLRTLLGGEGAQRFRVPYCDCGDTNSNYWFVCDVATGAAQLVAEPPTGGRAGIETALQVALLSLSTPDADGGAGAGDTLPVTWQTRREASNIPFQSMEPDWSRLVTTAAAADLSWDYTSAIGGVMSPHSFENNLPTCPGAGCGEAPMTRLMHLCTESLGGAGGNQHVWFCTACKARGYVQVDNEY